jgi:iron complex outermembrane receptor protein
MAITAAPTFSAEVKQAARASSGNREGRATIKGSFPMTTTRSRNLRLFLLASATTALLQVTAAQAQTAAAAAPAATEDEGAGLVDIVVTARKRDESLVKVPISITALSGDALAQRGIKGINELNDFVPGLRYENSAANRNDRSFQTIAMRGMYPGDSPNRQGVTVFIDGVAVPGGATPGLTNVAQVEIVKGPQSAYFGRSTFAGAINYITKAPSLTELKGTIDASYASYDTRDVTASIEGPIVTDKLAVRLSGHYYETEGQYKNAGYGGRLGARKTTSIDFGFIAKPFETTTIRGYGTYWQDHDGPSAQAALTEADYNCNIGGTAAAGGRTPVGSSTGFNYICGNVGDIRTDRMAQNTASGAYAGGITGPVAPDAIAKGGTILPNDFITGLGLRRKAYNTRLLVDQEIGDHTLSAAASHNRNQWAALTDTYNRVPGTPNYYSTVYLPYDIENNSAEVRLSSPGTGRLTYMVGGNYYWESIDFFTRAFRPPGTAVTNLGSPSDYRARTFGVFGSAAYEILDGLKLSGEARYQWDTINQVVYSVTTGAVLTSPKATFKSFSPRIIANYEFMPHASIYASWARGTRPGTFNSNYLAFSPFIQAQLNTNAPGGSVPVAVPEEKLTMWETGLKGEFFDRRLRILSALYYGKWTNRQINQNVSYFATPAAATTSTATLTFPNGRTNLWGLELETTFAVTPRLTFEGTFNWAATDIRATSCSECVAINGIVNPVGNTMERYPQYSGTAAVNYSYPINDIWKLNARVDYIYTGKQYDTAANAAWINSASRFNARLGISNETYTLEVFGRNLSNDKTPSNILRNANPNASTAQGGNLIILAAPERRTFGVRGVVRF